MHARRLALACALSACALTAGASPAGAAPPLGQDMSCVAPAGDPAPNTPEWVQRDTVNQYCAGLRNRDQLASPAFGFGNLSQGAVLYADQTVDQLSDPTHPRGGITTLVPGSKSADPFRTLKRWMEAGRGRVAPVTFRALNGSRLRGHVFVPPASVPRPRDGYPGVVITDGSVQAYEELYYWAAEDLASNGYMVMTYDVQGQGDSDLFPESCTPTDCSGVPYQQNYNFYQGAEDSLSFFLSAKNPYADLLDADRVGLAGHSLGAAAVSVVGQCDRRVKAIVAWDNLGKIADCNGVTIAPRHRSPTLIHAPAMGLTNDYGFWTQPTLTPPDPHAKDAGYQQVADAGFDAQTVAFRGATHLTYSYIPLVFQANELSERMASYFTTAWFDLQLRGDRTGLERLTAARFDGSADATAIGAGVYDPAAANPADPYAGNVPYTIAGIPVKDAVSFYYRSAYSLSDPRNGHAVSCADVRKGCA
jgi:dienelactone hydrolase